MRQLILARINKDTDFIRLLSKKFLDTKKWSLEDYSNYMAQRGNPIDELGLILAAKTIKKHIGVMLNGFTWWSTRRDGDWRKCEVLLAYCGKMKFLLIEQVPMTLLNEAADCVQLNGTRISRRLLMKRKMETNLEPTLDAMELPVKKRKMTTKKKISPKKEQQGYTICKEKFKTESE